MTKQTMALLSLRISLFIVASRYRNVGSLNEATFSHIALFVKVSDCYKFSPPFSPLSFHTIHTLHTPPQPQPQPTTTTNMQLHAIILSAVALLSATAMATPRPAPAPVPGIGFYGDKCWGYRGQCGKTANRRTCQRTCEGSYYGPGAGHCVAQGDGSKYLCECVPVSPCGKGF